MDQPILHPFEPILHPFVEELRKSERLSAFAAAFPAPARVSEPALPLLLAALHEELGRPLVLLAPEDQDARDAAEGAAWFLGEDRVGAFVDPSHHAEREHVRERHRMTPQRCPQHKRCARPARAPICGGKRHPSGDRSDHGVVVRS